MSHGHRRQDEAQMVRQPEQPRCRPTGVTVTTTNRFSGHYQQITSSHQSELVEPGVQVGTVPASVSSACSCLPENPREETGNLAMDLKQ